MEYYSIFKRKEILTHYNMVNIVDLEWDKLVTKRHILWLHFCGVTEAEYWDSFKVDGGWQDIGTGKELVVNGHSFT